MSNFPAESETTTIPVRTENRKNFHRNFGKRTENHQTVINVEPRYVIILNTSPLNGEVLIIRLSDEQLAESEKFEDMESYLSTLEKEYNFNLSNAFWITTEELAVRKIGE